MVYRRKGRPTFVFQARKRSGWTQLSTGTPDKRLADRIETMWNALAERHRAWDILDRVLAQSLPIGTLYDLWIECDRDVEEARRRLNDVDVETMVEDFLAVHEKKVKPDTLEHIRAHLRHLLPEGVPALRSAFTVERLTKELYAYAGKPSTIRKVHSDWSVFFAYLTDVRGLYERNPMERVTRPPQPKPSPAFYELATVKRIVDWQPTPERKALFALLYGTAMEISVALRLVAGDLDLTRKDVRAAGTKTHTRDRMARIAEWAVPYIRAHAKTLTPNAPLFQHIPSRHTASDWHAETVKALELAPAYPMKNARHHWAVRMLRSGAPVPVVQAQLGHATAKLTLDTYGTFAPSGADRDRWEQEATEQEALSAKGSAKEIAK